MPKAKNIWERVDFTPDHHHMLKRVAELLRITFPGAVEYGLTFGLVPLARGVMFFHREIEAAPGSRLAHEDAWAAFNESPRH
jgi:hypothetical protein